MLLAARWPFRVLPAGQLTGAQHTTWKIDLCKVGAFIRLPPSASSSNSSDKSLSFPSFHCQNHVKSVLQKKKSFSNAMFYKSHPKKLLFSKRAI